MDRIHQQMLDIEEEDRRREADFVIIGGDSPPSSSCRKNFDSPISSSFSALIDTASSLLQELEVLRSEDEAEEADAVVEECLSEAGEQKKLQEGGNDVGEGIEDQEKSRGVEHGDEMMMVGEVGGQSAYMHLGIGDGGGRGGNRGSGKVGGEGGGSGGGGSGIGGGGGGKKGSIHRVVVCGFDAAPKPAIQSVATTCDDEASKNSKNKKENTSDLHEDTPEPGEGFLRVGSVGSTVIEGAYAVCV